MSSCRPGSSPSAMYSAKFPRLVRDLAASLHKDIQLDIRGKDVALDRSLIESLSDPLTHMVRNAVDHGIELPEERVRAGKGRQGLLSIDARHEAGQVVVEIADDGRGIDPERIAKVALAKGLITAEKLDGMSAKDKTALIFLPGLSTNTQVSDVSGRGVGMDVVKTNLDRLGGKVEIISNRRKGHHLSHQAAAHAGHHPVADRLGRRRALRHPADQRGGDAARAARPGQDAH